MCAKLILFLERFVRRIWKAIDYVDCFLLRKSKAKLLMFAFLLLFFGGIIFVFNQKTPLQWDDFKLAFVWTEQVAVDSDGKLNEPTQRISSITDIFTSQYNHYFTWGGRTVVHVIAQFLLFINPLTADILNTVVYLLYVLLIYYHIIGKRRHDVLLFLGVNILVWLLQPVFGETILWLTGSANYLWGTMLVLMFLLPYRLYDNTKKAAYTVPKCVGMFLLGVIAGWTNENTVAAAILITASFLLYYYYQKWRIPSWAILGLIGLLIGYIIMIVAPGNFHRATLRTSGIPMDAFHLGYRFLTSTQHLFEYLGMINLLGFMLLVLFRTYSKEAVVYKRSQFLYAIYMFGVLAAVYVMLFSPFFPPRAWFGAVTFNIISFGVLFSELRESVSFMRRIRQLMLIFGFCFFGFTLYEGYRDVNMINEVWNERKALIEKHQQTDEKVVLHYRYSQTKFALSDPPFLQGAVSLYYDIDVEVK